MYPVSTQGVDERMINVHYYYYYCLFVVVKGYENNRPACNSHQPLFLQ